MIAPLNSVNSGPTNDTSAATRNTASLFARVSRNSDRIIIPINDSALARSLEKPAFYCLHDITGTAGSEFVDLARRLDAAARFFGVQAPPRRMQDEQFGQTIDSMAQCYTDALERFQPEGPFFIGGFCAGSIVALEVAQQLSARKRAVGLLVAIDAAPENTRALLHPWNPSYLFALASNVPGWIRHGGLSRQKDGHSLLRRIGNSAITLGRAAAGRNPAKTQTGGYSIEGWMDLSRYPLEQRRFINRFYGACFRYFPQHYDSDVIVYEADTTPLMNVPQFPSRWRGFAPKAQSLRVPGTHHCLMREPYVAQMAQDMERRIRTYFEAHRA